jgi:uncharacterized protein DUF397
MSEAHGEELAIGSAGWRKSSHSNPGGECVQIATLPNGRVAVRNSRHLSSPVLVFGAAEMAAFVQDIKNGGFQA